MDETPYCCYLQLFLPEGGLHADINGDGVLDHVQVSYTIDDLINNCLHLINPADCLCQSHTVFETQSGLCVVYLLEGKGDLL